MSAAPPRRRPPVQPRPFFTLAIVYMFVFFFIYALALVAPALFEVLNSMPPGPEQEQAAQEAAHEAASGRIGLAFLLALVTVVLGAWSQKLPGFREPR